MRILRGKIFHNGKRVVARTVIDQKKLVITLHFAEDFGGFAIEKGKSFLFVIAGYDQ